jgi:RNA polymerase primary sigma factor
MARKNIESNEYNDRLMIAEILDHPILNYEEERTLLFLATSSSGQMNYPSRNSWFLIQNAQDKYGQFSQMEARDELIRCNYQLVLSIVRKYADTCYRRGIAESDLFQEGVMGLMRAIQKFDLSLDKRLSTYATWWIKQKILSCLIGNYNSVNLKQDQRKMAREYARMKNSMSQALGCEASVYEVAVALEIQPLDLQNLLNIINNLELDGPLTNDETQSLHDMLTDLSAVSPEEQAAQVIQNRFIFELIEHTFAEEDELKKIIYLSFGFDDGISHSLEEIAVIIGGSRETVRNKKAKALKKLGMALKEKGGEATVRVGQLRIADLY